MQSLATSRWPHRCLSLIAAPLLLAFAGLPLNAQVGPQPTASSLPATPPTVAPAVAAAPPEAKPHRADVAFADGQLTVRADNSSLHQILRSISRITGMTITGGVVDQRVYGIYGPGNASTILATLLDGTGVNMFIREGDAHQPTELTLTPRSGGPAAPITAQDEEIGSEQPVPAVTGTHALAPGDTMQVQITPGTTTPQPPSGTEQPSTPQQGASTTLTPEQVYQKMLQMQKDRAAGASSTPSSSPQTK